MKRVTLLAMLPSNIAGTSTPDTTHQFQRDHVDGDEPKPMMEAAVFHHSLPAEWSRCSRMITTGAVD